MYSLTWDVFCFHTWLNKSCIFCVISVELWEKLNHLPFFWGRRYKHSSGDWIRTFTSPEQKVSQSWLPQTPILSWRKQVASFPFFGRNERKWSFLVTAVYVTVLWRDCAEGRLAWLCSEMEVTCWLVSCWVNVVFILKSNVHCASWCAFSYPMLFGAREDFRHPAAALGCESCGKPWHWSEEKIHV